MFHSQKSFEKSLRSTSSTSTTYQVPIITPLKTEIHKGCTGKAHACGSIKSTNSILVNKSASSSPSSVAVKVKAKCENKPTRKNSLSSETVSDSGSESWNSNGKDTSGLSSSVAPAMLPKPLKRTKSVNYGSSSTTVNGNARRRTSDSVINADVTDNNCNAKMPNVKLQQPRGRLLSDGDGKQQHPTEPDSSRLRRSSSFRSKNVPPLIPPKPKPVASSTIKQNGFLNSNGRLRSSFRGLKNQAVNWNAILESSFNTKFGGGNFRILDKNLLASKVN